MYFPNTDPAKQEMTVPFPRLTSWTGTMNQTLRRWFWPVTSSLRDWSYVYWRDSTWPDSALANISSVGTRWRDLSAIDGRITTPVIATAPARRRRPAISDNLSQIQKRWELLVHRYLVDSYVVGSLPRITAMYQIYSHLAAGRIAAAAACRPNRKPSKPRKIPHTDHATCGIIVSLNTSHA